MSLLEEVRARIQPLDADAMDMARARQDRLIKPQGALGRLEQLAIQIAGIRSQARPNLQRPVVVIMAADHGIASHGVSAYPIEVSAQMVINHLRGGAGISVLARHVGAQLIVVDMGVASDLPPHPALLDHKIARGTADFSRAPAMSREQARQAVETGIVIASDLAAAGVDVLAPGDKGIGNTTASSAIVAAITGRPVAEVTGRGTGIDDAALARKIALIEGALSLHRPDPTDGLDVLAKLGGFEIGGLAGLMIGAVERRVPVLVDGFISGAAALLVCTLAPAAQPYLIAAHRSVERGHQAVFAWLKQEPLLDLGMRLGEGTGAALGISLCQAACKILNEMATFEEAGVSDRLA